MREVNFISGGMLSAVGDLEKIIAKHKIEIEKSDAFIGLYTKNYVEEPLCLAQLGIAMYLNKPIYFLIEDDAQVPDKIRKVMDGFAFWSKSDTDSLKKATEQVVKLAMERGHIKKEDKA